MFQKGENGFKPRNKAELEVRKLEEERERKKERLQNRIKNYRIEFHFLPPTLTVREAAEVLRVGEAVFRKRFQASGFEFEKASVNGYLVPKERLFRFMALLTEDNDWQDRREIAKAKREAEAA